MFGYLTSNSPGSTGTPCFCKKKQNDFHVNAYPANTQRRYKVAATTLLLRSLDHPEALQKVRRDHDLDLDHQKGLVNKTILLPCVYNVVTTSLQRHDVAATL